MGPVETLPAGLVRPFELGIGQQQFSVLLLSLQGLYTRYILIITVYFETPPPFFTWLRCHQVQLLCCFQITNHDISNRIFRFQ